MNMIATQHPFVPPTSSSNMDLLKWLSVGKSSRIHDGTLVRVHAQPRNKYEGLHFVVQCTLKRTPHGFEILGYEHFLNSWNEQIHLPICHENNIQLESKTKQFFVQTKSTRWFVYDIERKKYTPSSSSEIDNSSFGFAVIMTRGPWYHVSKRNLHTTWHLVEWVSLRSD